MQGLHSGLQMKGNLEICVATVEKNTHCLMRQSKGRRVAMISSEMVEGRNPYGQCTVEMIRDFERDSNLILPLDYKDYLQRFNGAKFKRECWGVKGKPEQDIRIATMYGLHQGPSRSRLIDNYRLYEQSDLNTYKRFLSSYIIFAIGEGGIFLLLDLKSDEVCLLDPDFPEPFFKARILKHIVPLARNFTEFVSGLMSESEHIDATMSESEAAEFRERLKKLRQQFEDGD